MKASLIVVVGFLATVGCGGGSLSTGEGPITVTHEVQAGYEEFLGTPNPLFFAISLDGEAYGYSYCQSIGACRLGRHRLIAVQSCEKYSRGVPCRIYANANGVIWDGPTLVGLSKLSKTAPPIPDVGPSKPVTLIKCRLPDGFVLAMVPERCLEVGGTPN